MTAVEVEAMAAYRLRVAALADGMRAVARRSIQIPACPTTGRRADDPLPSLIPDDAGRSQLLRDAVALATGKAYSWPRYQHPGVSEAVYSVAADAAYLRCELRHWAVLNPMTAGQP